jgi:acyl carrier protein
VARRRRAAGLPGLAVQWGPISDAGYLARESRVKEVLERVMASGELTARDALDALPALAASGQAVAGYAVADWSAMKRQLPIGATPLFADLSDGGPAKTGQRSLREEIANLNPEEARLLVADLLADEVSSILRLQRDRIDIDRPISEMGFDSLMALELRLAIEARLGQELPLLSVGGGTTLNAIAARVVRAAKGETSAAAEDVADLIARHELAADPAGREA